LAGVLIGILSGPNLLGVRTRLLNRFPVEYRLGQMSAGVEDSKRSDDRRKVDPDLSECRKIYSDSFEIYLLSAFCSRGSQIGKQFAQSFPPLASCRGDSLAGQKQTKVLLKPSIDGIFQ